MYEARAVSNRAFLAQWARYSERANHHLEQRLNQLPNAVAPRLGDAIRHSALGGGKRFRAMLVYAAGTCLGAELDRLDAPALALEMIHAYSLIHDDLPAMDDDDLRRGQASCHIEFDEATAILAGDALQALAFEEIATPIPGLSAERQLRMVRRLAIASGMAGMAGGQSLDISATGKKLDQAALQGIHEHKTGALIRAALELGALAAPDADAQDLAAMDDYGRRLGLAFQVVDDILDLTQSSEQLGKQSGADDAMKKNTYPALMGLAAAQQYADELVHSAQQSLGKIGGDVEFLYQLADFTRSRDH